MKKNPKVFMISGQIGAGKTTYAKILEQKYDAVRFTPDEWLVKLYTDEIPMESFDTYYYKCCELSWSVAKKFIMRNIDVVLDFGFWLKKERDDYKNRIELAGGMPELIHVKTDEILIQERLKHRNLLLPEGTVYISDEMYTYFSKFFEPPTEHENPTHIIN